MSLETPVDAPDHIEADIEVDDGYETSTSQATDTTSIKSTLHEYLVENGRRYHAYYGPDKNLMPTDEIEQERLDIYHEIILLMTGGKLYHAPIEETHRVLDLGTGTGIWAVDYATEHPEAEVTGLDLSPIQPNWVPPNCRFEVDDFELDWAYKPNTFDYIHGRIILHSVKNTDNLFPQVMKHLKPGGWFEVGEIGAEAYSDDNTLPDDWPAKIGIDKCREAYAKLGRIIPTAEGMASLMRRHGFVDVQVITYKLPMSPWPKDPDLKQAGYMFAMSSESAYQSYGLSLYTRVHRMTAEEAYALAKRASDACMARKTSVHAYAKYFVVYGRKPEA